MADVNKHFGVHHFGRVNGLIIASSSLFAFVFTAFIAPAIGGQPHWTGALITSIVAGALSSAFPMYVRALEAAPKGGAPAVPARVRGRGQETPGEDPLLSGAFAIQFVRGMQGDDAEGAEEEGAEDGKRPLLASAALKHFAACAWPTRLRPPNRVLAPAIPPTTRCLCAATLHRRPRDLRR